MFYKLRQYDETNWSRSIMKNVSESKAIKETTKNEESTCSSCHLDIHSRFIASITGEHILYEHVGAKSDAFQMRVSLVDIHR